MNERIRVAYDFPAVRKEDGSWALLDGNAREFASAPNWPAVKEVARLERAKLNASAAAAEADEAESEFPKRMAAAMESGPERDPNEGSRPVIE